jgi:ABC-2 type transport system permease protein
MLLVVVGVIVVPTLLDTGGGTKDVGMTGVIPGELERAIQDQGITVDITTRVHRYDSLAAGEAAVRDGDIDVLVVDARRLEWEGRTDDKLRAVVTGAIQLVAVGERAAAAGVDADALLALIAPVPVDNVELSSVAGRSPDDETAAFLMTVVLFIAITTYGNLVLAGVVEEKSSRVVEVLLARVPARNLLAGKVAGIGLLGLAQMGVTAIAAVVAVATVDSFEVPAARGTVFAWAVVWFVLGYALYAVVYGALGSLASRTEDAQSVAGPVMAMLLVGYFASFAAIGSPDSGWARLLSFFPGTAPLAMPNRFAMGAVSWWEPVLAVAVTLISIAGLIVFSGRVYAGAILHTGPTIRLRDAWRRTTTSHVAPRAATDRTHDRLTSGVLGGIAAGVGLAVGLLTHDFVIGITVGAAFYAAGNRIAKSLGGRSDRHHYGHQ